MDSNNFVGASGQGYDVYVGGKKIGNYPDLNTAQQAFNGASGGSSSSQADGTSTGSSSTAASLQSLLDAVASGDTQKLNESIRQFNANLAENQRQYNTSSGESGREFDVNTGLRNREDYSSLAEDLLKTAASLRGPADYFQYNKFLSGGKDLFQQLYGDQPIAQFGQPVGGSVQPLTIDQLMTSLGFTQAPKLPTSTWDPATGGYKDNTPPAGTSTIYGSSPSATTPPVMDTGGKIAGPAGSHILAILQAGEKVVPVGGTKAPNKGPIFHTSSGIPVFDTGGTVPFNDPSQPQNLTGFWNTQGNNNPSNTPSQNQTGFYGTSQGTQTTNEAVKTPIDPASYQKQLQTSINASGGTGAPAAAPPPTTGSPTNYTTPAAGLPAPTAAPSPTNFTTPAKGLTPPTPAAATPPTNFTTPAAGLPSPTGTGNSSDTATGTDKNPLSPPQQTAPPPYQISPAVYDSMSPTGQALLRSLAESSGWNWDDYLAQINAQRPIGTAPSTSIYNYFTPASARASSQGLAGVY